MKPVAWIASDGESFSFTEPPSKTYLRMAWWKPVYLPCPADQLKAAQVEVLREAAEKFDREPLVAPSSDWLRRLADELERSGK